MSLNPSQWPAGVGKGMTPAQEKAQARNFAKFTLAGFKARLHYLQTHLDAVHYLQLEAALDAAKENLSKPIKEAE